MQEPFPGSLRGFYFIDTEWLMINEMGRSPGVKPEDKEGAI